MPRFRLPLAALMAMVAIVAVDIALVRVAFSEGSIVGIALVAGALPMTNLIVVVGLASAPALRRREPAPGRIGFLLAGGAALSLFVLCRAFARESVEWYGLAVGEIVLPFVKLFSNHDPPRVVNAIIEFVSPTFSYGISELVLALLGGWVARLSVARSSSMVRLFQGRSWPLYILAAVIVLSSAPGLIRLRWQYLVEIAEACEMKEFSCWSNERNYRSTALGWESYLRSGRSDSMKLDLKKAREVVADAEEWSRKAAEQARLAREYRSRWWCTDGE